MSEKTKEMREKMKDWMPEETRDHMKAAHKEMREGLKALFPPEVLSHRRRGMTILMFETRAMILAM